MSSDESPLSGLWDRTYQIGVVVRDLEAAIEFYEGIGIGPFVEGPSGHALDRKIYGEPEPDAEIHGRIAPMGGIEFELLQPVRGKSIQAEFLAEHGEGVVHLCAHTDDLARDVALLEARGVPVISSGEFDDGGCFAYFDTRRIGGLVLELFQPGETWQ